MQLWPFLNSKIRAYKPGQIFFKPKHVKSKDKLFAKYKRLKKSQKYSKNSRIDAIKPALIAKSAIENSNQCLQCNGNLIFYCNDRIVKINLKTLRIEKKFPSSNISMCAIPNQQYFVIDFFNNSIFIINKSLQNLKQKRIKHRDYGNIIYLDGLIYLFTYHNHDSYHLLKIEAYDLYKNKWKKALSIKTQDNCYSVFAAFEGKIIVAPNKGSMKAFDPFCNSISKILKLEPVLGLILLVANDKVYCIQSGGYVFESLPRDYTQWLCIGKNSFLDRIRGTSLYSLYKDSIYFVIISFSPAMYEFNLKTRSITFVGHP